ncbi:MAG: D-alanyl-D-alanine carboxypeptidase family protein [Actinocrinis sp.]
MSVVDADALTADGSLPDSASVAVHGSARPVPIASLAKVMTAFVVLADHPLAGSSQGPSIVVTQADADRYASTVADGESAVEVRAGERITERQALEALLLGSANNVAVLLADWDGGGVSRFVDRMNTTAARLGLRSTHYADPAGLDRRTVSTAADQVRLALNALRVPAFAAVVAMPTARIPVAGTVENHDAMLGVDGIVGVKTGLTNAAGAAMVVAARQSVNGRRVLIVGAVLGVFGDPATRFGRVLDAGDELVSGVEHWLRRQHS